MTDYVKIGNLKSDSYDLNPSQFSLIGTTLNITPGGIYVFATDAEAITGTSTTLIMNPANTAAKVANAIAAIPAGNPTILDSAVVSTTVGNTTNETTIYTFSIPANTLGTAGAIKCTLVGTCLQNAGAGLFVKLKYGSTTVAENAAATVYDDATTSYLCINAYLAAQGATNSQFGTISSSRGFMTLNGGQGTSSENSTGALNLVVTAKWNGASANATLTIKYAILEKIAGV